MSIYLSKELMVRLQEADNRHCAYCYTKEINTGQPMTIDHVIPESSGGLTDFSNLCFCCRRCNEFKGSKTKARDPLTREIVHLFHPRQQDLNEHFRWDETGTIIIGLTTVGRATIVGLNMNDEVIVAARRRWVSAGWHPPELTLL